MQLVTGTLFAGRYRIRALIGRGGMGCVYRAEHTGLGRDVALKVLGRLSDELELRFAREAHAIARLDHPGCVRILDHGETELGDPYIAMELVEGDTLAETLAREAVGIPRALQITRGMLAALAHAHAHGVIHRDLKPENVMLVGRRVVLIDFGLARLRDAPALTGAGIAMGSPSYIAPERLLGQPHDARSDLYAIGVILYEMLGGLRPFLGATPEDIIANVLARPPRPLRALVPEVSPALDAFVRRALAKDPARRFADAEEMRSALDEVVAFDAEAARAVAPTEREVDEASASMTVSLLAVIRPSPWQRVWTWLRYGRWRWRHGH